MAKVPEMGWVGGLEHRAAERYAYCRGFTLFSWFYSPLNLLATVALFASSTVSLLQTWKHTDHRGPRVSNKLNLQYLGSAWL